ncbi:unnamed protein product [Lymnaea stagnalis]|uniref:Cytochrome P450 n=1 Tax=Lymnaea stagnalis TaxID=6523 RepID=A0AAV2H6P8_LYMST
MENGSVNDILGVSCPSFYLLLATFLACVYLLYNQRSGAETWDKYGVKHAKLGIVGPRQAFTQLLQEYGDTVGFKRGPLTLLTKDLSIVREVMIKDFTNFVDRTFALTSMSPVEKALFFLQGRDWRRIRQILSPAFSTGKLKQISRTVEERARKLSRVLEDYAKRDQLVPVKQNTGQYASEIIARMAFGIETNCLGGPDDEFTHYSKTMLKPRSGFMTVVNIMIGQFPWLNRVLIKTLGIKLFDSVSYKSDKYFNSVLHTTLEDRLEKGRKGQSVPTDFIQSLISARTPRQQSTDDGAPVVQSRDQKLHNSEQNDSWSNLPKFLTEEELIAQSMLIIFAGFETTATSLQMCFYNLAKYPEIQAKVYEELTQVAASDVPTKDELTRLVYMEQFINETLRLYPPVPFVSRRAAETRTYGSVTIPKGAGVTIPIFAILKDPRNFHDPERFDPDRFSEDNKSKRDPIAFMPFGCGPRTCIGLRLAYLELKMALVHVLRKVRFELNERTEPRAGVHGCGEAGPTGRDASSFRIKRFSYFVFSHC